MDVDRDLISFTDQIVVHKDPSDDSTADRDHFADPRDNFADDAAHRELTDIIVHQDHFVCPSAHRGHFVDQTEYRHPISDQTTHRDLFTERFFHRDPLGIDRNSYLSGYKFGYTYLSITCLNISCQISWKFVNLFLKHKNTPNVRVESCVWTFVET